MDESGNGSKDDPLIVGGAALAENFEEVESEIDDLYQSYSAEVGYDGLDSFERFKVNGFHAAEDPFEISIRFFDYIARTIGLRCFMVLTDRHHADPERETDLIVRMYVRLLADIVRKYSGYDEILVFIEENNSLKRRIPEIEGNVRARVGGVLSRSSAPLFRIEMASKKNPHSMAIIDYVMIAVKRWWKLKLETELDTNIAEAEKRVIVTGVHNKHVRTFNQIRNTISMIYSLEYGLVYSRRLDGYQSLKLS